MNNETGLDWLARNVHVWPDGMREVLVCYPRNVDTLIWSCVSSNAGWITKDQWLARRAELQNKPSWKGAPERAEWLAQDEDGEWKWLAGLPGKYVDGWTAVKIKGCCKGLALGGWRDTLEKRPEQKAFQPFISIEDNQDQKMKQDNGWFERGDLPPVGIEIEAWFDDGRECWHKADVIGYSLQEERVLAVSLKGTHDRKLVWVHHFRPIRTDRDVLIEIIKKTDDTDDKIADAILAAGFSLRDK